MPRETRVFIAGMDSDSEDRLLPKEKCRELFMIRPGVSTKRQGAAIVERGTQEVQYTLPAGSNEVIGQVENIKDGNIIYFVYNSNEDHSILEFNFESETIGPVLAPNSYTDTKFLNFSPDHRIVDAKIFDDNLVWVQSNDMPRHLNIESAKAYMDGTPSTKSLFVYGPKLGVENSAYQKQFISAGKYPPLFPPTWEYGTDEDKHSNLLRRNMYQFRYRYVYHDKSKSTFSPISKVTLPQGEESFLGFIPGKIQKNNYVDITVNTGHSTVVAIEIVFRKGNIGEWYLINSRIKKVDEYNSKILADDTDHVFTWYGDDVAYAIPDTYTSPNSFQLPLIAKSQEVTSDNSIVYGNYLQGYDNIDVNVDIESVWEPVTSPSLIISGFTISGASSGILTPPALVSAISVGSVVVMTIQGSEDSSYDPTLSNPYKYFTQNIAYEVVADDLLAYPTNLLANLHTKLTDYLPPHTFTITNTGATIDLTPTVGSEHVKYYDVKGYKPIPDKFPTWKKGSYHRYGFVYIDPQGRHGGVQWLDENAAYNPWYSEKEGGNALQSWKCVFELEIQHEAPDWAVAYQIVYGGGSTQSFISGKGTFWDVPIENGYYSKSSNSLIVDEFSQTLIESDGFEYTYQKGDKIRFIYNGQTGSPIFDKYTVGDILGYDESDKRINFSLDTDVPPHSLSPDMAYTTINFEIFRESTTENKAVFQEIGEVYPVIEDNGRYFHGGSTQDQTAFLPAQVRLEGGDCYIYQTASTFFTYKTLTPTYNWITRTIDQGQKTPIRLEQQSYSQYYPSQNTDEGRFHTYNENFIQKWYVNKAIYGGKYFKDTQVNEIFNILSDNEVTLGIENGELQRIVQVQFTLKFIQDRKITSGYINRQLAVNPGGTDGIVLTDTFLSELRESMENWGTQHPESVIRVGRFVYFWDARNGIVVRDDANGPDDITIGKRAFSTKTKELSAQFQTGSIRAGFDRDVKLVYFTLENESDSKCVSFYQDGNYWNSFHPHTYIDCFANTGNKSIAFKDGVLWLLNRTMLRHFYGVKQNAMARTVFNENAKNTKTWLAIGVHSNKAWYGPEKGDLTTENTQMYGAQETRIIKSKLHYQDRVFYSDIPRDMNTNVSNPIINGDKLQSSILDIKLINDDDEDVTLFAIDANYLNNTEI